MSKWISVKDSLPQKNVFVLAAFNRVASFTGDPFRYVACITGDGNWWSVGDHCGGTVRNDEITHWMKLPNLPRRKP